MTKEYNNEYVYVRVQHKTDTAAPYIHFTDKTDVWNGTAGYTRKVRGIDKAFLFIDKMFTDEKIKDNIKFKDVNKLCNDYFKLSTRTYCSID